jgi:hypothetical protein
MMFHWTYSIGSHDRRTMTRLRGFCLLGWDYAFPFWLQRCFRWRTLSGRLS